MSTTKNNMSNHIDKLVIRLFLLTILIFAAVFAYRYSKYTPCKEVDFSIKTSDFREGKLINFVDNTKDAKTWDWNFGDSTAVVTGKEALHIYKKPGAFYVSLTVNGICEKIKKVVIKEKQFVIDSSKIPKFDLPNSIVVGKKLIVKDKTLDANTWEWRFGETANENAKTRVAAYRYKEPGLKTVSLIVNGDIKHAARKKINVLPIPQKRERINQITSSRRTVDDGIPDKPRGFDKPEEIVNAPPEPDKPKTVPYISETKFKNDLMLVSRKRKSPNSFEEYFCGDLNKEIIVNGKTTTFLTFCELIIDKKLRIKEVKLYRVKGSNCIKNITITRSKFIF